MAVGTIGVLGYLFYRYFNSNSKDISAFPHPSTSTSADTFYKDRLNSFLKDYKLHFNDPQKSQIEPLFITFCQRKSQRGQTINNSDILDFINNHYLTSQETTLSEETKSQIWRNLKQLIPNIIYIFECFGWKRALL